MGTFFSLVGLVLFIVGVIALAAGITYLVVKLFPPKSKKPKLKPDLDLAAGADAD
jgi:hypothetical protein